MNFIEAVKCGKKTHNGENFYMCLNECDDIEFRSKGTDELMSCQRVGLSDLDVVWEIYEENKLKPEPLKDKKYFTKEEIKSAVLWLKKELEKGAESSEEFDYIWVDRMIDEAFEDVKC